MNALHIDPGRKWKGPWRWFSQDIIACCKDIQDVRNHGTTIAELAGLARYY